MSSISKRWTARGLRLVELGGHRFLVMFEAELPPDRTRSMGDRIQVSICTINSTSRSLSLRELARGTSCRWGRHVGESRACTPPSYLSGGRGLLEKTLRRPFLVGGATEGEGAR